MAVESYLLSYERFTFPLKKANDANSTVLQWRLTRTGIKENFKNDR